jgi:hypothetical protein
MLTQSAYLEVEMNNRKLFATTLKKSLVIGYCSIIEGAKRRQHRRLSDILPLPHRYLLTEPHSDTVAMECPPALR